MNGPLPQAGAVDSQHPWPGLDSFSETTRAYFHGREEEIGALARRIQRKSLTILFGQSGLGKTSILRAGIVPRLRPEGYCPVYVRVSYAADAASPAEQIKAAILRATAGAGAWTRAGAATSGESLWEFMHHRGDQLLDADGKPLVPLLIFDQFEELFTLAQTDDAGRQRAADFVEQLADLVENRPPRALEAKLDLDDSVADAFDFARSDYRVLIALREDYLAHLESLRTAMPSITQNRMRLARMTGAQALEAVVKPGGRLVSQEVAEAIVRFVAGGAELPNAEVEPSLLSLICRELNNQRIAQGRAEISTDLLAGSHASILEEFYARAVHDMPDGVEQVIEDELLTEGGYRENLAEERVLKAFAAAGAPPDALSTLVNRRLLRIEERLDVRRVELTHDVLCPVVRAARERRHEKQHAEAARRQLEQQRQEQQKIQHALARARRTVAVCATLAVVAVAGASYGYLKGQQATRTRAQAEKLVGYILDDFYDEFSAFGRIELAGNLAGRTAAYYAALPEGMRNADTERSRAMVLYRESLVGAAQGKFKEAMHGLDTAMGILEHERAIDGTNPRTIAGLARVLTYRSVVHMRALDHEGATADAERAIAIAAPLAQAPNAPADVVLEYSRALIQLGSVQGQRGLVDDSISNLSRATALLADPGRRTTMRSNLVYADALSMLHLELSQFTKRRKDAESIYATASQVVDGLLRSRPGARSVLGMKGGILFDEGAALLDQRRPGEALKLAQSGLVIAEQLGRTDTKDQRNINAIAVLDNLVAAAWFEQGKDRASLDMLQRAFALYLNRTPTNFEAGNLVIYASNQATLQAEHGKASELHASMQSLKDYFGVAASNVDPALHDEVASLDYEVSAAHIFGIAGTPAGSRANTRSMIVREHKLLAELARRHQTLGIDHVPLSEIERVDAELAYNDGDYARASESAANAIEHHSERRMRFHFQGTPAAILRALALAKLGRTDLARQAIEPLIAEQRAQIAAGSDDQNLRVELASALLASALAQPEQGAAQLKEARALVAGLPAEMQQRRSVQLWRKRIDEATNRQ